MVLPTITKDERTAAIDYAISFGRDCLGEGQGYVHPRVCVGSMNDYQWRKLVDNIVSGWIIARSKQLSEERFGEEGPFLAMGEEPEPSSLGNCAAILPALAEFVTARGLEDKTISEWAEIDVLLFVWNAADMLVRAGTP